MRRLLWILIVLMVVPVFSKKEETPPLTGVQSDDAWALAKAISQEEGCVILGFDYGRGHLLIGKITFKDLFTPMRTNVLFRLEEGLLDVELVDLEEKDQYGNWEKSAMTLTKSPKKVRERILKRMHELFENPDQFNAIRDKAYADVDLHYLFLRSATELATERWVEKYMLGKSFDWNVTFVDIEKNKGKKMSNYKYIETYTYGGKGKIESLDNLLTYRHFYIRVYTNSDKNIMQQKDSRAKVVGVCKEVGNHKDSFDMILVAD